MGCIVRETRNLFSYLIDEGTVRHVNFEECYGFVSWGKRLRNSEKL